MLATAEQQVTALRKRFREDIQSTLHEALVDSPSGLFSLLRYHLGWEEADGTPANVVTGKGLRPILCLTACELAGGDWRRALPAAAALELVHNFSLIHDDIQDRDERRWGRPTLWTVHGESKAIAAGNALRVLADRTLMRLAAAGLKRLHFKMGDGRLAGDAVPYGLRAVPLGPEVMLPSAGQAALGIEVRAEDERIGSICARLNHYHSRQAVTAERALLAGMGGGCSSPLGTLATVEGERMTLRAVSFLDDTARHAEATGDVREPEVLGNEVAGQLRA